MNKLDMAHEYFMKHGRNNSWMESDVIDAWKYADAMQAEADKREVSIEEAMKDHVHDYIYGRVCACGKVKDVEEEWQPDWSQAPDWATHFFCEPDEDDQLNGYFAKDKRGISIDFDIQGFDGYGCVCSCKTFNYQGNWQDSLRKRPQ